MLKTPEMAMNRRKSVTTKFSLSMGFRTVPTARRTTNEQSTV